MSNKFYEWWKNHRKVVTYGAFIILFGFYLSPIVKEAKYKNLCIKYSTKGALTKFNKDDIGETLLEETGFDIIDASYTGAALNAPQRSLKTKTIGWVRRLIYF